MASIKVNVHEAKAQLSRYLEQVERGDVVVICRRNVPVAELRGVDVARRRPRPLGLASGTATLAPDFDMLPEDVLAAFEGGGP